MRTFILLLLCSLTLFAQDKPKKSDLTTTYEKVENRTWVTTKTRYLGDVGGPRISLYFSFTGQQNPGVDHAWIMIDINSRDWNVSGRDRTLFVLADETRLQLRNPDVNSRVPYPSSVYSRLYVSERLIYRIDKADLEKVGNGKTVELKLGNRTYKLGKDTRASVREMVQAMSYRQ